MRPQDLSRSIRYPLLLNDRFRGGLVTKLSGVIAATFTPMTGQGEVDCGLIPPMVDRLIADGVQGLYVCGSTGEGPSMTTGTPGRSE